MLRSSEGRTRPTPRFLHSIRWAAIGLLVLAIPGLAQAASVTFDVLDPSGYGATVTLEDGAAPGTLNIDIESFGPLATDPVGDILGVMIQGEAEAIFGLQASGADVDDVDTFPGFAPNFLVDVGAGGLWTLNGIGSTNYVYTDPTETLSVAGLAGTSLSVYIGLDRDQGGEGTVPGIEFPDGVNVIKAEIPAIPEPGTATLMMLGLIGLAVSSNRLKVTGKA